MNQNKKCIYSPNKEYRYTLWREFDKGDGYVQFIGLNPSTATDEADDPTVRRCINYARDWGFGGLCMTNIFAYRATLPKNMKAVHDPIGPENNRKLIEISENAGIIVAAWGTHGAYRDRGEEVKNMLPDLHYLRLTKDGHPAHPLYLPKDLKPTKWEKT